MIGFQLKQFQRHTRNAEWDGLLYAEVQMRESQREDLCRAIIGNDDHFLWSTLGGPVGDILLESVNAHFIHFSRIDIKPKESILQRHGAKVIKFYHKPRIVAFLSAVTRSIVEIEQDFHFF